MKKTTLMSLLLLAFTISCSKSGGGGSSEAVVEAGTADTTPSTTGGSTGGNTGTTKPPTNPTTPTTPSTGLPALSQSFSTNVEMFKFAATQEDKYEKAARIVKLVVATKEFRDKVLNHTYNGKKTFVDNGGRTNAQIYQSILDAAETLQPAKNNRLDVEVELYYSNNSVVGYTYPTSKRVWVNSKFFSSYGAANVAGNLFHEWLHKLGYGHAASYSTSRDYSVPYAIGYLVAEIGKDFL